MILPDVNVLIYAFRPDAVKHQRYRQWLQNVVDSGDPFGMSPQVLASVVRICTHPRAFARPSSITEVLAFADVLLRDPACFQAMPGPRHWQIFAKLCSDAGAKGNLVQDAWFAALAIESGAEWITTDGDYARFAGLRWRTPF